MCVVQELVSTQYSKSHSFIYNNNCVNMEQNKLLMHQHGNQLCSKAKHDLLANEFVIFFQIWPLCVSSGVGRH